MRYGRIYRVLEVFTNLVYLNVLWLVACIPEAALRAEGIDDADLPALLDQFDAREILHVTFGSVLREESLRERLMGLLRSEPEAYAGNLEAHFLRHLKPFRDGGSA